MTSPYAGIDDFPEDVPIPDDSDPPHMGMFNPATEGIANRTRWLKNRLDPLIPLGVPLDTIGHMKSIAGPAHGAVRLVKHLGVYTFDSGVSTPEFLPWVAAANDSTPGRWVRLGNIHIPGTYFRRRPLIPSLATLTPNVTRNKAAPFYQTPNEFNGAQETYGARFENGECIFNRIPGGSGGGSGTTGLLFDITDLCRPRSTLTRVRVAVLPSQIGGSRAAVPATQMSAGIFVQTPGLTGLTSLKSASDFTNAGAPDVATYEAGMTIEIVCDQNNVIDESNAHYWLQIWDEASPSAANCRSGNKIQNILLDFTNYTYAPVPGFI